MLGKPIKLFRNRAEEGFEEKVVAVLRKVLPGILLEHDHETRARYLADRERYLEDIKSEVVREIGTRLDRVDTLSEQYKALEISAKDVLREKIVCMYENNKDARRLRHFERRALDQYYIDYKAMKGNSYIDIIYERMCTWEVEPDDYEN